jgi:hypothetical protein
MRAQNYDSIKLKNLSNKNIDYHTIKMLFKDKLKYNPTEVICDAKNQKFSKALEKFQTMLADSKTNAKSQQR